MKIARCVLMLAAMSWGAQGALAATDSSTGNSRGSWFGFGGDNAKHAVKTKKVSSAASMSKTPQVIRKMTDAPKRLVSSTKNMLTPKSQPTKSSSTTSMQASKNLKEPQQGFFKSLFNPEPPPPPQTIKDWMKLKQIHP